MGLTTAIIGYILLVLCGIGMLARILREEIHALEGEKIEKILSVVAYLSILAIFLGIFIHIEN